MAAAVTKPRIPGIPTVYANIRFRSRLEARWAAFFDLLGWKWEYEPFDLNGWIPDFILVGSKGSVLVEVKPITLADESTFDAVDEVFVKMVSGVSGTEHQGMPLLLVGTKPFAALPNRFPSRWMPDGFVSDCIGEVAVWDGPTAEDMEYTRKECLLGLSKAWSGGYGPFAPDLLVRGADGLFGHGFQVTQYGWAPFAQAWAESCNQTQWKGGR